MLLRLVSVALLARMAIIDVKGQGLGENWDTCTPFAGLGEDCDFVDCAGGLICGSAGGQFDKCVNPVTTEGGSCAYNPVAQCTFTQDEHRQLYPYIDGSSCTCLVTASEGQTCGGQFAPPCADPLYCGNGHCLAKANAAGGSCAADPKQCGADPILGALFCQASLNGNTCQRVGTNEYAGCAGDLSGNSCAAPRYCTGPNAPVGSQNQCRTKASLGGSCRFDPVNGCSTGLYCTSTDQTCQAISTQPGQTCGLDSNACLASAGLYCVASTQLCAQKATTVGATCAFDPLNGCASTSAGQQLYCRASDATCQVRLDSIGADCRANPISACGSTRARDGSIVPLYCSAPSYLCAAKLGAGASCSSNPAQACLDPLYCSSNNHICISRVTGVGGNCNADPYAQCGLNPALAYPGYNGQLYPLVQVDRNGNQVCSCALSPGPTDITPVPGTFGLTSIGDVCSADPTFACGYTSAGVKLYCALSTSTCQEHVRTVGDSCAYDYLGACGIAADGSFTQLYPSIPVGSTGHADCTCVAQADVALRPSSRARARARSRRNLSLCPGSHTACPVGNGFECIDVQSNIEQCGGCSENGGVDCTALGGVAAVGCVGGRCEIWACEEGFNFDSAEEACV